MGFVAGIWRRRRGCVLCEGVWRFGWVWRRRKGRGWWWGRSFWGVDICVKAKFWRFGHNGRWLRSGRYWWTRCSAKSQFGIAISLEILLMMFLISYWGFEGKITRLIYCLTVDHWTLWQVENIDGLEKCVRTYRKWWLLMIKGMNFGSLLTIYFSKLSRATFVVNGSHLVTCPNSYSLSSAD